MIPRRPALCLFLLAAGCAGEATREEGPLDRMIAKTNAYSSFHLKAEITDGKQSVPIEMAWQAPDRALLKYGTVSTTLILGGKVHSYLRGTTSTLDSVPVMATLKERYPGLSVGTAPQAVFSLGNGLRAQLSLGRLGARLGWLEELRAYKVEENVYRQGQTVVVLREDGFIARTDLAGTQFVLRELKLNETLPDSLFAPPPTAGIPDVSARYRDDFARGLDDAYHCWILETSTEDETLERLVGIELGRKYEPEKMTEILKSGLEKSLDHFRTLHPDARPEALHHQAALEKGKTMAKVEMMEEEIQKEFEKSLDRYLRHMVPAPPLNVLQDIARRWQAAVKRQVDAQIRRRFEAVFDAASKE